MLVATPEDEDEEVAAVALTGQVTLVDPPRFHGCRVGDGGRVESEQGALCLTKDEWVKGPVRERCPPRGP